MRKYVCGWIAILLLLCPAAFADDESAFTLDLSEGMSGNDVRLLQEKLIQYGFYIGMADGTYGSGTTEAVKQLEGYMQVLTDYELACQTQALTVYVTPDPVVSDEAPSDVEDTPEPVDTPEPEETAVPARYMPGQAAGYEQDGVAGLRLLRLLESGAVDMYLGEVQPGVKNEDARRAQNRLIYLNYLDGTADGVFGENSMAAMRQFQRDNGLEVTGLPNGDSRLIFDSGLTPAKQHVYNMLVASDIESDQVMNVQKALNTYGFTLEVPDGLYGSNTEDMLTTYKEYLFEIGAMNADGILGGDTVYGEDGSPAPLTKTSGIVHELQAYLVDGGFDVYHVTLEKGSEATSDILRLQRRLFQLGFLLVESRVDGDYGTKTVEGVTAFQARNGLAQTGVADEATQRLLFSENAKKVLKPYLLKVSLDEQRVYAYSPDANEDYTVLEQTFVVSTGKDETPTPTGTFEFTGKGERWHFFSEFNSWAQYAFHIDGGIMFHSVIYDKKDVESSLQVSTLTYLGYKASHGCIRMKVEDAKWIWENCPTRTTVIIY